MMLFSRPWLIFSALGYFAAVTWIGLWAARRTRNARDFFIAGQRPGLLVTGLATTAAAFSGFVFLGGPGLTYRMGTASFFILASTGFTSSLLCWVVAKRLRLLAAARDTFTIPDVVGHRFGRGAAGWAAIAVLVGTTGYLGAQMQALGILIETVFGTQRTLGAWSLPVAMAIGIAVVLFYSTAGGMLAGVYTDLLQGALMGVAAVAVFGLAVHSGGGLGGIVDSIRDSVQFGPHFLDPMGGVPVVTALGFFLVFSVGTLGQPHMLHKFFMLRRPRQVRWLPLVIAISQSLCLLIWVGLGLAVPALVASGRLAALSNPDQATPTFLLHFAPGWLAGIVLAGALAAIMSTADSFINIGAAALVRDLPRALGREPADELRRGRFVGVILTVGAALFAWAYGDLIALLGTFAFGTFAAGLAPALAVGLNWKGVTRRAATWSIAVGVIANLGLEIARRQSLLDLPTIVPAAVLPAAFALVVSFLTLFVVSALDRSAIATLPPDVEAVLDA
jgi:Na+/proline symporter